MEARTAVRTSQAWWSELQRRPQALRAWLFDQYRGEVTASGRIEALRDRFAASNRRAYRVLSVIAGQEQLHAAWVAQLLVARGETPEVEPKRDRYWKEALAGVSDLQTGCAVGAHAEGMRLERIEVIARDPASPADVREVFERILRQERFHERAFRALAGAEAMAATRAGHQLGRGVLGLAP